MLLRVESKIRHVRLQTVPRHVITFAQIAAAIKAATIVSASITGRSCMWGRAALGESGGNLCNCNNNNFGVLQLNKQNIAKLGLTPEQYILLPLQGQVDEWAIADAAANNASKGYTLIDKDITLTVHFGHAMDGPLAACSQFGPTVFNNDINILESGKALPITAADGVIRWAWADDHFFWLSDTNRDLRVALHRPISFCSGVGGGRNGLAVFCRI